MTSPLRTEPGPSLRRFKILTGIVVGLGLLAIPIVFLVSDPVAFGLALTGGVALVLFALENARKAVISGEDLRERRGRRIVKLLLVALVIGVAAILLGEIRS